MKLMDMEAWIGPGHKTSFCWGPMRGSWSIAIFDKGYTPAESRAAAPRIFGKLPLSQVQTRKKLATRSRSEEAHDQPKSIQKALRKTQRSVVDQICSWPWRCCAIGPKMPKAWNVNSVMITHLGYKVHYLDLFDSSCPFPVHPSDWIMAFCFLNTYTHKK